MSESAVKEITILCKVVDNFGDIGVVYRLCRSLSDIDASLKLNLVVSNLETFKKIAGDISPELGFQTFRNWNIFDWNDSETCTKYFSKKVPLTILQTFQCGLPDWLDDILFSKDFSDSGKTSFIINIEYLTAEDWADDFHLLKGATRSASVKKMFFMPGFTPKTAGLILDKDFMTSLNDTDYRAKKLAPLLNDITLSKDEFKVLVFSYQKDFNFFFDAFNSFSDRKIHVYIAPGAGLESFKETEALSGKNTFKITYLPYMNQEMWDSFLCSMDFLFVRGEDSFARAVLTGKPFLWNIYPQDDEYHLVKLKAFLDKLNCPEINEFSLLYNRNLKVEPCSEARNAWGNICECTDEKSAQKRMSELLKKILFDYDKIESTFKVFATKTISCGNLSQKLMEYLPLMK